MNIFRKRESPETRLASQVKAGARALAVESMGFSGMSDLQRLEIIRAAMRDRLSESLPENTQQGIFDIADSMVTTAYWAEVQARGIDLE